VFSLTRNLLVIWPFFFAVGVMLDFAVNIDAVENVLGDFSWAVGVVVTIAVIVTSLTVVSDRNRKHVGS
jgi:hypothetical protein